ncbi:beta-lactamase class A [Kineosporia succinea]|uniref:Beta-lactamase n=2 Tax=Kineosporia succinea TaxID=84632 RepID=A0ABT9PDJ8_9ACTN|nr:class A beta-lactamase [Kineosporia succinea]MDP9830781.1 beta-lactamase class A [Kineosporia succinea]
MSARRLGGALAVVTVLFGCAAGPSAAATTPVVPVSATDATDASSSSEFRDLEKEFGATLGVYALDTGSGETVGFRADRRFAYASTFKALQAGVLLKQRTDREMDRVIRYDESDLLEYAPITSQHVETGMTLGELADASVRYSDNTAANLIFEELGGPRALDRALERLGDRTTHVDRIEPNLNEAAPGDIRDTSTPRALATDLRTLVLGRALNPADRSVLADLLRRNTTGDNLIRSAVPSDWTVGDKTGGGRYGTRNDIAVLWPPHGDPIVMAVLSTRPAEDATYDDALIARAAAVVVDELG